MSNLYNAALELGFATVEKNGELHIKFKSEEGETLARLPTKKERLDIQRQADSDAVINARKAIRKLINEYRNKLIDAPIIFKGNEIRVDDGVRNDLDAESLHALTLENEGEIYEGGWISESDEVVPLNKEEMVLLARTARLQRVNAIMTASTHKNAIKKLTSVEEIQDYIFEENWNKA